MRSIAYKSRNLILHLNVQLTLIQCKVKYKTKRPSQKIAMGCVEDLNISNCTDIGLTYFLIVKIWEYFPLFWEVLGDLIY